ncbi:MAG: polysaccharide deacetylase family protein [Pseudomonadota bacterium]
MSKRLLKNTLQTIASSFGPHRWPARGTSLVILMYHRVLPADDARYQDEQPGMIVHPETFAMHMDVLQQHFDVVSLAEWVRQVDAGEPVPRRAAAITFDDGWRDNLEFALPALAVRNLPATIFLVSEMMDGDGNYWPEQLATSIRLAQDQDKSIWQQEPFHWLPELHPAVVCAADAESRDAAIVAAKRHLDDQTLRARSTAMLASLGDAVTDQPRAILSWQEAREMQAGGLIEFGSHTLDHTRLTESLDPQLRWRQLSESRRQIADNLGKAVSLFCYPNGDHCPAAVGEAAQLYAAAVTTQGGWNTPSTPRHLLHRIGVHQGNAATPRAFRARLSGWL